MNRKTHQAIRAENSRLHPTSSNVVNVDSASVIESLKRSALPKEVTFGVYFSYHR